MHVGARLERAPVDLKGSRPGVPRSRAPGSESSSLVVQNLGADKQTVLLIGGGALADALQKQLGNQEVAVEHAAHGQEAATARALAPDLIVIVGEAAQDRGAGVIAQLPECPVLVVCSAEPEP